MSDTTTRNPDALRALAAEAAQLLHSGRSGTGASGTVSNPLATEATAREVIAWVARTFAPHRVAVACSMADAVLPHLVAQQIPGVDVLFLDTGYHFAETTFTRNEVAAALDVRIVDVRPEQTVREQDAAYGADLFARDPGLCCTLRKVEPLQRALADYDVWITGVRRDESPTRTHTPLVTWDERNNLVKVNPLAAWSFDELLDYADTHEIPVNPLIVQGYPSIGCAPCTRPVAAGEDPRAGRWAGHAKTECGLHT